MHVHTSPVSRCADIDAKNVVRYYSALGYSSIVITNHFKIEHGFDLEKPKEENVEGYLADYYIALKEAKKYDMTVLLGLEARFMDSGKDYLVYGIDESDVYRAYDYLSGSFEDFYKGFKNEKNVIIQAHPHREEHTPQSPSLLDGVEALNMHPGHNSSVALTMQFAKENPHLLITGGTDFHHENHQGMCALCTKEKIYDSFMLAKALKSKDYIFDVWGSKVLPYGDCIKKQRTTDK